MTFFQKSQKNFKTAPSAPEILQLHPLKPKSCNLTPPEEIYVKYCPLIFYAQNLGWKVSILRFLGAEEVSAEASLETVFGQNVILSLAFDWNGSEIAI